MAVQDLTPQLRTRLGKVERMVGWFVILAAALMLSGFIFYVYHTAKRKGWFLTKVNYFTLADTAAGLNIGDPVKLMGFDVGQITKIDAMPPEELYNVYVEFQIKHPYYGYLWSEGSRARLTSADLLGKRFIEVTKGTNGLPTYIRWPIRELTLHQTQSLQSLSNLVLGQQIPRSEADQVIAEKHEPITPDLLERLKRANISSIVVVDPLQPATNTLDLPLPLSTTNLTHLSLGEEVRRGYQDQTLIPALTPLSAELLRTIASQDIQTIRVIDRKEEKNSITAQWDPIRGLYHAYSKQSKAYWLPPNQSPPLTDRLESLVSEVEQALPSILTLTNKLHSILAAATNLTTRADLVLASTQPILTNFTQISSNLLEPRGSLGEWLLPTNVNRELTLTLSNASTTLHSANNVMNTAETNITLLSSNLNETLANLADISGNLKRQVQTNDQIVSKISEAITEADDLLQGLKKHWLLRSAFREPKANQPSPPQTIRTAPKAGKWRD